MNKLRILQVNKLYHPWIGGVETVAKMTAEGLADRTDMKVLVCSSRGRGVRESVNNVSVIRSGSVGIYFSMPVSFSFPFMVRKYAKQADVIILHDPFPLGDLAVLLSGFKGKVIVWWHSDIIKQKKLLKLINPVIRGILKRADAIFTTTPGYIDGSAYISQYRKKCRIVPYGIEVRRYLAAAVRPILADAAGDKRSVRILFVGRLVYYKGADVLIKAFHKVSGAELFMIGKGADEQELRAAAADIKDRIHFMGTLSDDELKSAFSDCDIFVLPSVEKSEAFGIVQLEAMVYGKPVINTDLDTSVPFVSIHGETGLTVPAGDAQALAEAMELLINDAALREKYGANAKKRVLQNFDKDIMCNNVLNECERLISL